jgi:hypothetical protein
LREIDLAHATGAKERANLIASELCLGGKGHEPQIFTD